MEYKDTANGKIVKELETPCEHRERIKSLCIVYFTLFLQSLGLAIAMTGVLPYLKDLDPDASKLFFSFIVAANPLGQFIFSPILGFWSNKVKSIRQPIFTSLVMFCGSSFVYSCLELFDGGFKYWMLITRFFMGAASANVAICRSYIAAASKIDERTFFLSMASLAQVSGFIAGPLLQAGFTAVEKGIYLFDRLPLSMYTLPGWVNVIFGCVNILLFMSSKLFKDNNIALKEQMMLQGKENAKETWASTKLDHLSILSLIFSYFIVTFNLVILESLGTPLSMDQFAFTKEETLKYNGILIGVGAFVSCIIFLMLPKVSKLIKEIDILIWAGLLIMALGKFMYIPFREDPPKFALDRNYTVDGVMKQYDLDDPNVLGCPIKDQPWCEWTPRLGLPEFIIGYFMGVIGYPVGVTLIQTLFSKILGARPQGTWMGWMVASGSMARIIGPVIIVGGYTKFGTIWTFSITTVAMMIPMILLFALRKRILRNTQTENIPMTDIKSTK